MQLSWKTCLKVGVSVFLLYICIHFWPLAAVLLGKVFGAAMPLLIGAAIAYILNILMSAYERHFFVKSTKPWMKRIRRPVCMVGALLTLTAIVALVLVLVVPQLGSCFRLIAALLPEFMNEVLKKVEEWGVFSEETIALLESIDWQSWVSRILSGLGDVVTVVATAVSSVFSAVITGLLALIFSFYVLLGKERIAGQLRRLAARYLKENWCRKLDYVLEILDDCFHRYIVGQCTEAVILGLLCAVGMTILRLPYAGMIGALVAVTALIPVAGAWIGAGVGAFLIVMVDPFQSLVFLIFILILQQLENNLIYPRIVGSSIGLPGIWVLAAITVGGGVLGVTGMLLGVPLTAAIYRILRDDLHKNDPRPEETLDTSSEP